MDLLPLHVRVPADGPIGVIRRRWYAGPLFVAGSAAAVQLSMAGAGLIVARGMDPISYGHVAYFFSVFGMVVLLGALGLTTQVTNDVARLAGAGKGDQAGSIVLPLLLVRGATLVPEAALAGFLVWRGNATVASACACGAEALLAAYFLGALQGFGSARLVAAVQLAQSALYLGLVIAWGHSSPEGVYASTAISYGLPLTAGAGLCLAGLRGWSLRTGELGRQWRSLAAFAGQAYAVSLVLAPFSALAILALGQAGRFGEAASLGVVLPLALLPSVTLAMVVVVQFHPHLCRIASGGEGGARWIDAFYRPFALAGIAASVVLAVFPREIISLLFTPRYVSASTVLVALAGSALLVTQGQLLVWALVAFGRFAPAIAGGLAQLTLAGVGTGLQLAIPSLPLWVLGVSHTLAAAVALLIWGNALRAAEPGYRWHAVRLAGGLAAAGVVTVGVRRFVPSTPEQAWSTLVLITAAGLAAALSAAPFLLARAPRVFLTRQAEAAA